MSDCLVGFVHVDGCLLVQKLFIEELLHLILKSNTESFLTWTLNIGHATPFFLWQFQYIYIVKEGELNFGFVTERAKNMSKGKQQSL